MPSSPPTPPTQSAASRVRTWLSSHLPAVHVPHVNATTIAARLHLNQLPHMPSVPKMHMPTVTHCANRTCAECSISSGCHWCSVSLPQQQQQQQQQLMQLPQRQMRSTPGVCHAIGSTSGCLIGAPCETEALIVINTDERPAVVNGINVGVPHQCVRSHPDYHGSSTIAERAPATAVIVALVVGGVVLIAVPALALAYHRRRLRRHKALVLARTMHETAPLTTAMARRRRSDDEHSDDEENVFSFDYGERERVIVPGPPPATWPLRCSQFWLIVNTVVVAMVFALTWLMYPTQLRYALCNSDSILSTSSRASVTHIAGAVMHSVLTELDDTLRVDIPLLFAVWNPNKFLVRVSSATATVLYRGVVVATGVARDIDLIGETIVDVACVAHFHASLEVMMAMAEAQKHGQLYLDFDLNVGADISVTDTYIPSSLSSRLPHYNVVNGTAHGNVHVGQSRDTSLCKCPS